MLRFTLQPQWRLEREVGDTLDVSTLLTLLAAVQSLTWDETEGRMKRLEELYARTRFFRRHR